MQISATELCKMIAHASNMKHHHMFQLTYLLTSDLYNDSMCRYVTLAGIKCKKMGGWGKKKNTCMSMH